MEKYIDVTPDLVGKKVRAFKSRKQPSTVFNSSKADLSQMVIGEVKSIRNFATMSYIGSRRLSFEQRRLTILGKDGNEYTMTVPKKAMLDILE